MSILRIHSWFLLAFTAIATMPDLHAATIAPPELPRVYIDTTYQFPSGATVRKVNAGGNVQNAINAALPGDIIELEAGVTFYGNLTLPEKIGDEWICIRTSRYAELPPSGERVTPSHAVLMPKLVTKIATSAINASPGAHHFRFLGIEVSTESSINYNLIQLGANETTLDRVPHHFVFDRCYLHADPTRTLRRAIALNSGTTAVINCYVSDCHEVGADSQALGGWNGPGPYKIVNNYLEGAAENICFGGADTRIADLVPSDIEIRGNHLFKPLTWKVNDPSYAGTHWTVKNLFELKNARRVLIEGNIIEYSWTDGQVGFGVLFTPRNQNGGNPWAAVQDITFQKNIVRHTGSGINILGMDDLHDCQPVERMLIRDNLLYDVNALRFNADGRIFQIITPPKPNSATKDLVIEHNTAIHGGTGNSFVIVGDKAVVAERFVFRNNIAQRGQYGFFGSGKGEGLAAMNFFTPDLLFEKNVIFGSTTGASNYPAGNFFVTKANVGFTDAATDHYRLLASSPYHNAATDGKDIGADFDALEKATIGAESGKWPNDPGAAAKSWPRHW